MAGAATDGRVWAAFDAQRRTLALANLTALLACSTFCCACLAAACAAALACAQQARTHTG